MLVDGLRHGPDREKDRVERQTVASSWLDRVERQTVDVTDRQLETHLNARVLLSISASVHFPVLWLMVYEMSKDKDQDSQDSVYGSRPGQPQHQSAKTITIERDVVSCLYEIVS